MNATRPRWFSLLLFLVCWAPVCWIPGLARAADAWTAPEPLPASAKTVFNAPALTGLWYAPSQNGHGFALTFAGDGRVAATWYVYQGTRQVWLIGSGTLVGNQAVLQTFITSGANFPPNFNPGAVTLTEWGTLTLDVQACDRIAVSWSSTIAGYGSGSVPVQPLLVAGALPCAVSTNDDRADGCPGAIAVAPNGAYAARIDPETDQDFYRIDVTQRGTLTAQSRSSFDMLGTLYDANCNALAENDDAQPAIAGDPNIYDFSVVATLSAGTYYVRAKSYGSDVIGDYSLVLAYDTNIVPDDYGDTCLGAPDLPIGDSRVGRIDPMLDVDYFRVQLTGQTALLARVTDSSGGLDTVTEIRDASCQVLARNDDFDSADAEVSLVLGAGTYYVSVRASFANSTGGYTLALSRVGSADDHGDFCTISTALAVPGTGTGQIAPVGDRDFFAFELATAGTLNVRTANTTTLDPRVTLFDEQCSPLNDDDDDGPGNNAFLSYAIPPGRFFLRVRAADGTSTGGYDMNVQHVSSTEETDEHGNDCASATVLSQYGSAAGFINTPNDRDVFRIETELGPFIAARVYADPLRAAIAILDANCNVIGENPGPDDGNGIPVRVTAGPGTYYIRLRSSNGSTGFYTFNYGPTDSSSVASKAKAPRTPELEKPHEVEFRSAQATPSPQPPRAAQHAKAIANPSALSGLWYDPAQNGQGVQITFDANGTVALTWYVYQGTRQVWLIGSAALSGNRVALPMFVSSGADFLPAFDPNAVTLTPWGNITLDVRSCSSIGMSWAPTLAGYGAGSMELSPLIVSGGLTCAVSSEADDHGDSCAAADAAALNGSTSGRIDPTSDQDFFRVNVGSAGTLTVQSSGSSTLNPSGTLFDASCTAIATSDDAAGREFSIARTVTAGTYYVRVAASGGASTGDYVLGTAFAPSGGGNTSAVELTLRNALVYDVDFAINGGAPIRVGAGASLTQSLTLGATLNVSFELPGAVDAQGRPLGDLIGGTFDPVANPSGALTFVVDNEVGAQRYFAPVISNKTQANLLIGVNMGTPRENRCNCTVGGNAQSVRVGYYFFLPNSNVRAYAVGSNYAGAYAFWGTENGSGGRSLLNIGLVNLLESPSGRVQLKYFP